MKWNVKLPKLSHQTYPAFKFVQTVEWIVIIFCFKKSLCSCVKISIKWEPKEAQYFSASEKVICTLWNRKNPIPTDLPSYHFRFLVHCGPHGPRSQEPGISKINNKREKIFIKGLKGILKAFLLSPVKF